MTGSYWHLDSFLIYVRTDEWKQLLKVIEDAFFLAILFKMEITTKAETRRAETETFKTGSTSYLSLKTEQLQHGNHPK